MALLPTSPFFFFKVEDRQELDTSASLIFFCNKITDVSQLTMALDPNKLIVKSKPPKLNHPKLGAESQGPSCGSSCWKCGG
jgi:hypothetical protein